MGCTNSKESSAAITTTSGGGGGSGSKKDKGIIVFNNNNTIHRDYDDRLGISPPVWSSSTTDNSISIISSTDGDEGHPHQEQQGTCKSRETLFRNRIVDLDSIRIFSSAKVRK
jgi:hypothetical protein